MKEMLQILLVVLYLPLIVLDLLIIFSGIMLLVGLEKVGQKVIIIRSFSFLSFFIIITPESLIYADLSLSPTHSFIHSLGLSYNAVHRVQGWKLVESGPEFFFTRDY